MNAQIAFEYRVKTELHEALVILRDEGPEDANAGICHNTEINLQDSPVAYQAVVRLKELLRYYASLASIDTHIFPIEGSERKYDCNHRKWDKDTEYGQKRWALLDTLIDLNRSDR